jgi:hypothetical protein
LADSRKRDAFGVETGRRRELTPHR